MKIGFYAGSFDPFTIGHLHIVKAASKVFDKVYVGMGVNPNKKRRYDMEKMQAAINLLFNNEGLNGCECIIYEGLTVDEALKRKATFLVRGVRNGVDDGYEENLAQVNEEISGIDTIYFRAGECGVVSSSMANELIERGRGAGKYLPKEIEEVVKNGR